MAIRIITDSASDIPRETARQWDIAVAPLTVRFGDEEYLDGVTIQGRQFYEKLIETDTLPKTSQVTPARFEEEFRKALQEGDQVLCITISSDLSGTYQSAMMAAEGFGDQVTVVDSRSAALGEYVLVRRAVELRDQGLDPDEIIRRVRESVKSVRLLALVDTLEYLRLGGRISAAAAIAGNLLSIKPVITVADGVVAVLGKARGSRNANNLLSQFVEKNGGIDTERPVCLGYSGLDDAVLQKYIADSQELLKPLDVEHLPRTCLGATVGTYTGPGAVVLAFFSRADKS